MRSSSVLRSEAYFLDAIAREGLIGFGSVCLFRSVVTFLYESNIGNFRQVIIEKLPPEPYRGFCSVLSLASFFYLISCKSLVVTWV